MRACVLYLGLIVPSCVVDAPNSVERDRTVIRGCSTDADCKPEEWCGPGYIPGNPHDDAFRTHRGMCRKRLPEGKECVEDGPLHQQTRCLAPFSCKIDAFGDHRCLDECVYPTPVPDHPGFLALAQADLAQVNANASLSWHAIRDTPSMVLSLDVDLPCLSGETIIAPLQTLVAEHSDLFQLDLNEYEPMTAESFGCNGFAINQNELRGLTRQGYGPWSIARDRVNFGFRRIDDATVRFRTFIGTYLGLPDEIAVNDMLACLDQSDTILESTVAALELDYSLFEGSIPCEPTTTRVYTPQSGDEVRILPSLLSWQEQGGGILMTRTIRVELEVAPENHTSELLGSDAACPSLEVPNQLEVGFVITIDAVTGEVLGVRNGISCIVC